MNDPVRLPEIGDEARKQYREEGYVLLPGLISPEATAVLRENVMEIMATIGLGTSKLRQTSEYLAGSAVDALVNSANLRKVAGVLMDGPATLYLPFTAVKSGDPGTGGGGEFHFHQDNQYTRFDGPGINLWFALTPMRADNGALRVVPRSHLHGTLTWEESPDKDGHRKVTFEPADAIPILMEPGDCVAFTRLTVHGSGPNASPENRVAYAAQFHRDDINYSTDGGATWKNATAEPRWNVGPVDRITPPKEKLDGH